MTDTADNTNAAFDRLRAAAEIDVDKLLAVEDERVRALPIHDPVLTIFAAAFPQLVLNELPYMAKNRFSVRRFATAKEANDCDAGYALHPAALPDDASPAMRRGWADREQWELEDTPEAP